MPRRLALVLRAGRARAIVRAANFAQEETPMRRVTVVVALVAFALAAPGGAPSAQESVGHIFRCPPQIMVKANWKNKIETQPTDFPLASAYENLAHSAPFKESSVNVGANTVQCVYVLAQSAIQAPYVYKVHRKIISCTGQPGPTIDCKLKKD
jgi:hypothetical protein